MHYILIGILAFINTHALGLNQLMLANAIVGVISLAFGLLYMFNVQPALKRLLAREPELSHVHQYINDREGSQ